VHFSVAIDRESVLLAIFTGLCDVWRTLKSATFVMGEGAPYTIHDNTFWFNVPVILFLEYFRAIEGER
jgi:hypothetical protein